MVLIAIIAIVAMNTTNVRASAPPVLVISNQTMYICYIMTNGNVFANTYDRPVELTQRGVDDRFSSLILRNKSLCGAKVTIRLLELEADECMISYRRAGEMTVQLPKKPPFPTIVVNETNVTWLQK